MLFVIDDIAWSLRSRQYHFKSVNHSMVAYASGWKVEPHFSLRPWHPLSAHMNLNLDQLSLWIR